MGTKTHNNYEDLITFTRASEGTYLDSDGLLKTANSNEPRVEYDADGNRLGLLVEEARTNLVQQSENFENVYWSGTSATPTINTVVSPTGQTDGTTVTATGSSYISKSNIITSQNTTITFSAFLKAGTVTTVGLHFAGNLGDGANDNCDFDLSNGTVSSEGSSSTATIEDVGNGWYRCSNTYTTNGTGSGLDLRITTSGAGTYYVFGAQAETASFKSSYIKTTGSTATRSFDVASILVSSFGYNNKEITVMAEFIAPNWASSSRYHRVLSFDGKWGVFNDGSTASGTVRFRFDNDSDAPQFGANNLDTATYGTSEEMSKVAFALKNNDAAITKDGNTALTDTSGDYDIELRTTLHLGAEGNSANGLAGHLKTLKVYPRRLTNAQLQDLTS
jgi:hypothetical protein